MAETSSGQTPLGSQMFRETAMSKMASADDLDHYLRVTNPSAWVLLGAVAVLLVAAIIWGCTATLPVKASTTGVLQDGKIVCFLPLGEEVTADGYSKVKAAGYDTTIASIDVDPFSQREVEAVIGSDYTLEELDLAKWSKKITVALPEELSSWDEGDDVPIEITTREFAPISYLFGGVQS